MSNGGGDFQSGEENSFLSLECDVFRPLDESCQVSGWLNAVTESEILWSLLEKRIGLLLNFLDCSFSFNSFTLNISANLTMIFRLVGYE